MLPQARSELKFRPDGHQAEAAQGYWPGDFFASPFTGIAHEEGAGLPIAPIQFYVLRFAGRFEQTHDPGLAIVTRLQEGHQDRPGAHLQEWLCRCRIGRRLYEEWLAESERKPGNVRGIDRPMWPQEI